MTPEVEQVRAALDHLGIKLTLHDGKIRYRPTPPPLLLEAIKEHRDAIVGWLEAGNPRAATTGNHTDSRHAPNPTRAIADPAARRAEAVRLLNLATAAGVRLIATPWGWIDYEGPWPSARNHRLVLEHKAELLELLPPADPSLRPSWEDPDRNRRALEAVEAARQRRLKAIGPNT